MLILELSSIGLSPQKIPNQAMFYWWVGGWVELFTEKEKAPVKGLCLCYI